MENCKQNEKRKTKTNAAEVLMIFSHFQAKTSIKYINKAESPRFIRNTKKKDNNNKQTKNANQTRPLPK